MPTIDSVDGYRSMYGRLLREWNLLAVDVRGTGASTPLDCPVVQHFSGPTATVAFQEAVGRCATALNHRWRYPDGRWAHASDLFTSAAAAEDLAAVIRALRLGPIDLYGDSYGSYLAQVVVARFPRLVRSVVLDSTYETVALDPWYRSTIRAMPAAFDTVCARAPACATAAPGSSWTRLARLAGDLRRHPISAFVPSHTGRRKRVSMRVVGLVDLLNDAAEDPQVYQDIDAAARAWLEDADPRPLLRLYDQRLSFDENYAHVTAAQDSAALYFAVACLDYRQLFELRSPPARRLAQLRAAEAALPAGTFAPFTLGEWLAQNENTEAYTACLRWPAPRTAQPAVAHSLPLFPRSLPVLVLVGQLDTVTPAADARTVLSQVGGRGRLIEFANTTHVAGSGNTTCASDLVRRFIVDPTRLRSLDASCASRVPAIHAVGSYPDRLTAEPPLKPARGSTMVGGPLRLAAAAVLTAGDAIARYQSIEGSNDSGLFGGTMRTSSDGSVTSLRGDQLIPGVVVSGRVVVQGARNPVDGQVAVATLTASAPGMARGRFTARWSTDGPRAAAEVRGAVGRLPVAGTMPAP